MGKERWDMDDMESSMLLALHAEEWDSTDQGRPAASQHTLCLCPQMRMPDTNLHLWSRVISYHTLTFGHRESEILLTDRQRTRRAWHGGSLVQPVSFPLVRRPIREGR